MAKRVVWAGTSLDLSTVGEFEEHVRSAGRDEQALVVDVRALEFVDSTGVRSLVTLKQEWKAAGGILTYEGFREDIRDILDIMGITEMLLEDGAR